MKKLILITGALIFFGCDNSQEDIDAKIEKNRIADSLRYEIEKEELESRLKVIDYDFGVSLISVDSTEYLVTDGAILKLE